jgi:hypothetical protein
VQRERGVCRSGLAAAKTRPCIAGGDGVGSGSLGEREQAVVTEHLPCQVDLGHRASGTALGGGVGVHVTVRVMPAGQAQIGAPNFGRIGAHRNAEHLVVIHFFDATGGEKAADRPSGECLFTVSS